MLPPITFLGWIHTGCGIAAILIGAYALNKYKVISFSERAAKIYLLLTLITASTALAIYNQGGFRIAHVLAILTLLALMAGTIVEKHTCWAHFQNIFLLFVIHQLSYFI